LTDDPAAVTVRDPRLFLNREISLLAFHRRVLAQAQDPRVPLLERLRFLCISCTNLDEFFEVRVATIRHQLNFVGSLPWPDGRTPTEVLLTIREQVQSLMREQYQTWNNELKPQLAAEGIRFLSRDDWNAKQRRWLHSFFHDELMPVLSPLGLDPAHPFPRILNKSLNVAVTLKGKDAFGREADLALVRAPRSLPRLVRLPRDVAADGHDVVLLSAILQDFVDDLFPGVKVKGAYPFRVTRNSELWVDEFDVDNLALALKDELLDRGFARAVRLEITDTCPRALGKFLLEHFELTEDDMYRVNGPVNLNRVGVVYDMVDRPDLKYRPFQPRVQAPKPGHNVFDMVREHDIMLHHPYDSFSTVVDLLKQAAGDPDVLAIKQTLYRTGRRSVLVDYLIEAARAGKDVTVVVELRARFDEEANIDLANRLQEAGVQVVYGVVSYKTHAKMLLIVRREGGKPRRYVHLGTGNYHQGTSAIYTDIGLITCDKDICEDVHKLFQQLSGLSAAMKLKRLLHSPFTLHPEMIAKIEREAVHAKAGRQGKILARMNALSEPQVIEALYRASQAGVEIVLFVRGICVLRPGVPGVSDNIRVHSIVGRFLEHSRIFYFRNGGDEELYASSADWMERNLFNRVETCFPILNPELRQRVFNEALENYMADNSQAWKLEPDGGYTRIESGDEMPHSAQASLLARICGG
jgi:polyphosphate kinase